MLDIVLFQPEIPHNTGAVGRTCVAVGAKLWLVRPLGFQLDDRRVKRAGLDYWPHLQYEIVDDWQSLTERLPVERMWFFTKTASAVYTDAPVEESAVYVFGTETSGLPTSLLQTHADHAVRIPIREEARSLNLSVSVGIAAFDYVRRFPGV